jgi:hypothetical protein
MGRRKHEASGRLIDGPVGTPGGGLHAAPEKARWRGPTDPTPKAPTLPSNLSVGSPVQW